MRIADAFRLQPREVVAFVGGGGKSATLFRLADELVAQHRRVLATTTTHLAAAQADSTTLARLRYDAARDFVARVGDALAASPGVLIVGAEVAEGKVSGVPRELVDELAARGAADVVLYEADGARLLPFKAPAAHEPVIASATTLLVPVIGASVLGAPLDDAHVQRAEIVARLAGARRGEPVTPVLAARVLAHPEGGLKSKPAGARALAFVNQVDDAARLDAARALARLLLGYAALDAVAIGAAQAADPIRETHRRVAAIVLAAGASTRMEGRIKQLLPWRGKTLIENAVGTAAQSDANEVIVVLGASADEIRAAIHGAPVRVAFNREWQAGHSTSLRAGLRALDARTDAAIFINADQPLLTPAAVNRILQRYRETDASIVAAAYAGRLGSPVLFRRVHFDELTRLRGEQGGRELLARHRVERVELEARLGYDVDTWAEYAKLTRDDGRGIV